MTTVRLSGNNDEAVKRQRLEELYSIRANRHHSRSLFAQAIE
jgi:hypothetical protein